MADTWTFPEGICGFPDLREFTLEEGPGDLELLRTVGGPTFRVVDPGDYLPDVAPPPGGFIRVIVSKRRGNPLVANLAGPLLFDPSTRTAWQIVLKERV